MHDPRDEFLDDLLRCVESYPVKTRASALEDCLASALKLMDRETILRMRAQLNAKLTDRATCRSGIKLNDGHLALRDIHGSH